ncbi:unnamed protein product [Vitrella brassicaformis CCMP3155]|uniref:Uncharacterized protein n=1 Tax=Vitrella brassicaformis (strain CCMP3155) TaxID=1169540 RepID=A0A0G4EKL6_VITBC|nr:unnamed protein product [Vitrella brassicaformis CCMP3155]|eukprot:CEL97985.1 unnamed protein product [Vitrella brassicaformis CCMP3155]
MAPICFRGGRGGGSGRGGGREQRGRQCFVCGSVMNQLRNGRRRCPYHDQHFATVYHQTHPIYWTSIHNGGRFHASNDGYVYASPTPEDTFNYATYQGVIVKISIRRAHLDLSFNQPGKVRFSPNVDYNIEAFAVVTNQWSLPTAQWTNVHVRVNHV